MKISGLNFGTIKNSTLQKNKNSISSNLVYKLDKISFTSKTPEQILLTQEAKSLSKEAYSIFARGKNIQKQGQKHLETSSQILEKAQKIQEKSKKEYDEISSAFKYAKENKLKASADPFKNIQTIYENDSIEEYRDKHLLRKAIKTPDGIILFEYGKTPTRKVFNSKGELVEYCENYKTPKKSTSTSDFRLIFENGSLFSCDYGVIKKSNSLSTRKTYQFSQDNSLYRFSTNLNKNNNGFNMSDEDFIFHDKKVSAYSKNCTGFGLLDKSYDEMYSFLDDTILYIKDYNSLDEAGQSIDKVFCFKNSKLQKAMVGIYSDYSTRLISKYFTYTNNERPEFCYLNHQKQCLTFDFDDDRANVYDKLIYLG